MPSFQISKSIQQEVRNARMVGEFAVKIGVARIPSLVLLVLRKAQAHSGSLVVRVNPDVAPQSELGNVCSGAETPFDVFEDTQFVEPIIGYDVLTTQQVIDAYDTLSDAERTAVLTYEQNCRARGLIVLRYDENTYGEVS